MSSFKPGDTVKLKSGSPTLTIIKDYGNGYYQVTWFLDGLPKEYDTVGAALELYDPKKDDIYSLPD